MGIVARRRDVCARALVLVCVVVQAGCGDAAIDPEQAQALARPHYETFARFDRWARRAWQADAALRDRARLEEAAFAPLRREESVAAAWILSERGTLELGSSVLPPDSGWVRVRHPELGAMDVGSMKVVDIRPSGRSADTATPCILLRRVAETSDGSMLTVVVAYRPGHSAR